MPMANIRRYDMPSIALHSFMQEMTNQMADDPFWNIKYLPTTSLGNSITNGGIVLTNKKDPDMVITLGLSVPANNNFPPSMRFGLFKNATPKVDCMTDSVSAASAVAPTFGGWGGAYFDVGLGCYTGANQTSAAGAQKFVVISQKEFVMITSEPLTYPNWHYPIRLYLGRCKPFEEEDPLVSKDFYGYFPHVPVGINHNAIMAGVSSYHLNFGRGLVKYSRAKEKYTYYNFLPQSQQPSPGVGGAIFVSPFYVYNPTEGVRGEFYGMRTAVLKQSALSAYPDGSIMTTGEDEYYVVHVNSSPTINKPSGVNWYNASGQGIYSAPRFFDSAILPNNGQRVLLFKIN
ncbi:hypothetical protein [Paenibacillus sp. FSL P2-0136]|uniref:hypothetical protein n=1 Tax=Paenibacillus sp. FSL P2-0136 TaxID=2975317 RepID=UPI0030DC8D51